MPTDLDDIRLGFRHRAGNDDPKRRSARHQRGTIDLPPIPEAAVSNPPANLQRLLDIMARLRDRENGCPWDIEQTFATIAPYTIEEAYEVADAIDRDDLPALKDELGDLLLQVVFHAQMASEQGAFGFDDVAAAISDKMVRRHPHVFGDDRQENAEGVLRSWEEIKRAERAEAGDDDRSEEHTSELQ